MAEPEGTTGQPTPGQPGPAAEPGTTGEPQPPEGVSQEPELPEKFRGKSPEEIVQMYSGLEQALGRQGDELGALRGAYTQLLERIAQGQAQQPPQPHQGPEAQPQGQWTWDNPYAAAQQAAAPVVQQGLNRFGQDLADNLGELAFQQARAGSPELFNGVEDAVRMFMKNSIRGGMLAPTASMNPESWRMAAWQMQGVKNQYKMQPPATRPTPVAATPTMTPTGKPPFPTGQPVSTLPEIQVFMDKMKVSKEDQQAILKESSKALGSQR